MEIRAANNTGIICAYNIVNIQFQLFCLEFVKLRSFLFICTICDICYRKQVPTTNRRGGGFMFVCD